MSVRLPGVRGAATALNAPTASTTVTAVTAVTAVITLIVQIAAIVPCHAAAAAALDAVGGAAGPGEPRGVAGAASSAGSEPSADAPSEPRAPGAFSASGSPNAPGAPNTPGTAVALGSSVAPGTPNAPGPPGDPNAPGAPGTPVAAGEDIRDIRGPLFIMPWWLIPALVAGVLLLGALGYAVWRWWRGRRRPRALLPFEMALERLESIRPLMQPPRAREFSTAASDIVRGYIELRFDVIATHQTTEEFLHDLLNSSRATLVRHRALLSEFLQACDLVKFAGLSLTVENMEALHQSARAFVLETAKPDPEPAKPETPPAIGEARDSLPST